MSTDSCATCRFFKLKIDPVFEGEGYCRRNAPVATKVGTRYADTCADDWCGQFEPSIASRSDGRYEVRYLDRPDATFREDGGVVFGRSDTFEGAKTLARACRRSPNVRGVQIVDLQYQPPADE